jgi:hypothetical protein
VRVARLSNPYPSQFIFSLANTTLSQLGVTQLPSLSWRLQARSLTQRCRTLGWAARVGGTLLHSTSRDSHLPRATSSHLTRYLARTGIRARIRLSPPLAPPFSSSTFWFRGYHDDSPLYFSLLLGSVSLVINITLTLDLASTQQQTRELPFFRNFLCRRCSSL